MTSSPTYWPIYLESVPLVREILACLVAAENQSLPLKDFCTRLQDESGDSLAEGLEALERHLDTWTPMGDMERPVLSIEQGVVHLTPLAGEEERTLFQEQYARRRMERNQIDLAQEVLYRLLKQHQESGDKARQALDLGNLATLFLAGGNADTAEQLLREAMLLHEPTEDAFGLALDQANLALVYVQQGRLEEARQGLETALDAFERQNRNEEAEKTRQNLERLASMTGPNNVH